jgi:23S rRNA pseudouridine1911/1915/1917 synthase
MVPEFSRSYLQQLLECGLVRVNGLLCEKASRKVKAGDAMVVTLRPTQQSQAFQPQDIAFEVVHQDEHVLVVDKPAGLVVHPAPGNWSGTLLNGLLAFDRNSAAMPRAGIVHRLDKDTSGLMVVARTRQAMDALVNAIAAREVSRQYLALGHHHWVGDTKVTVDHPIGRDPRNRLRMAVVDLQKSQGKTASTDFHLLDNAKDCCLVQCVLHTGRTHQIRVHMASLGHPLLGDQVYGGPTAAGIARQALHAYRLAFVHPVTGNRLSFESHVPVDFQEALSARSLRYNLPRGLVSP